MDETAGNILNKQPRTADRGWPSTIKPLIFYEPYHRVSYGCETWSLTLREEHRLAVFRTGC
jgi:hypothetical protein